MIATKILLVDDEPNILEGLKRVLGRAFPIETAVGGQAGLRALEESGPFAVVMSDMRMPGMSGVQFLIAVRERWPDTVRLMLTGNSDIQTAMDAVNEGCVFRFLTKPCPEMLLKGALQAGLAQHRLVTVEREILEKTLHGSVKILTEILALVNPAAFSRASRIHHTVKHMVERLATPDAWCYEVAAMLSQIGCVAFDSEIVEAAYAGVDLPPADRERFQTHPSIARELLKGIPRLELVGDMIAGLQSKLPVADPPKGYELLGPAELGAQLLKIAVDFDRLVFQGVPPRDALTRLKSRPAEYYPAAVTLLETLSAESAPLLTHEVEIRDMVTGMILDQDLRSASGVLLVASHQEITYPLLVRIRNLHQGSPIPGKIRVKSSQREALVDNGRKTPVPVLPHI